jgi:hypothetical protein
MKSTAFATLCRTCGTLALLVACGSESVTPRFTPETSTADASTEPPPPPFPLGDGGTKGDAAACTRLNIGMLGKPGTLPSANFQQWLTDAGTSATRVQTLATDAFTAETLAPFDVIVLDHLVREYTPAEAATFKTWVEAGGGVVAMTGYTDTSADFRANTFIRTLGVSYGGPLQSDPITTFAAHPITVGLSSVTFAGGYVVSPETASSYVRTSIASMPAGAAAYAIEASNGRAFVWGDEWIEFDSEWSTMPEIKSLWVNAFKWLAPKRCELKPPS